MNSFNGVGRVVRDPFYIAGKDEKTSIAKITVAIDKIGKRDEASFIPITCFGKQADNLSLYVKKGQLVSVEGYLESGRYEKNEREVFTLEVIATRIGYLGGKRDSAAAGTPDYKAALNATPTANSKPDHSAAAADDEDF